MSFVKGSGGVEIHYRVVGNEGPLVVLLHGLGLSGRFWFSLPEKLSTGTDVPVRVVAIDNRGTGQSTCPRRPWLMSHMADDVAAVVDSIGTGPAIVAGISMGGMVAQHVALRHADKVSGLLLMATLPGLPHLSPPAFRTIRDLVSLRFIDEDTAGKRLARLLLPESELPRASEHLAGWREALLEETASPRCFIFQLAAVATHSASLRLGKICCPTTVLVGEQDLLVPEKNSRRLASAIPGARLKRIPGVGHGIDILAADEVCSSIWELARVARPAS